MNFLAHFALSHQTKNLVAGSFLGDFIKGRLTGKYEQEVETGIKLHRAVDKYSDSHPIAEKSKNRYGFKFRRFGGIITDLAYDHLLARSWEKFYSMPLQKFSQKVMQDLVSFDHLPEEAAFLAEKMLIHKSLENFASESFIVKACENIDRRLKYRNPMRAAPRIIIEKRQELENDFELFFPQLKEFASEWLILNGTQIKPKKNFGTRNEISV
ncbi:MAG: hypothetical protein CMQ40_05795 [Gammaproteobacteria bacterium]|nr:hypothetical protein [Gammaproteobacteria bacterium]